MANENENPRRRGDDEEPITSISEVDPSKYLSADDLDGKAITLEIVKLAKKRLPIQGGGEDTRLVVHFKGATKRWLTCSTANRCLIAMFGRDIRGWIGKRVTIHPEIVDSFGKRVPAVRPCGSPDLAADITVKAPMWGKPPLTLIMHKTEVSK